MSNDKPNISISGSNIQSGITNIGGTQTFQQSVTVTMRDLATTVGGMNATQEDKVALQKLITELEAALKNAPIAQQADAEKIARRAKEAVQEAAAEEPEKDAVEAKANLLKESDANTCQYNDLALIKVDPADVAKVNPSIPFDLQCHSTGSYCSTRPISNSLKGLALA